MTGPTLIDLNPDKLHQGLCYQPFMVSLGGCHGGCNSIDDPSSRICVPNKTKDTNLKVFTLITGKI